MRTKSILIWISVALVICIGTGQSKTVPADRQPLQQESLKERPGRIVGRVIRADTQKPLGKATVTLWLASQQQTRLSVRTNATGIYEFPEVPPGVYRLQASRKGFVPQVYGQRGAGPGLTVTVEAGLTLKEIDFALIPGGVISGTVLDEDYEGVEDVSVFALRVRFGPGGKKQPVQVKNVRTDDLGNYRLAGLAPGTYFVQAGAQAAGVTISLRTASYGYVPTYHPNTSQREDARAVQVAPGNEVRGVDVVVRTGTAFSVKGIVLDAGGGGGKKQYSAGFARDGGTATMAVDQSDGSFVLRGLLPGEYTLVGVVSEDGRLPRRGYTKVRIESGDIHAVIEVGKTMDVKGKLQFDDAQNERFNGLSVNLIPEQAPGIPGVVLMEVSREFAIRELPAGDYRFQLFGREEELYLKQATCGGENYTTAPVRLRVGEDLGECDLVLSREIAEVSGEVFTEKGAGAGMIAVLIPQQMEKRKNPRHTLVGQADSNGQFRIVGVITGEYFAYALEPTDDAIYYDLEFPERNRDKAEKIRVEAGKAQQVRLKAMNPK